MKFLIVQLPPFSRHLIPLRSKYSSQNPVLKHPQSMSYTQIYIKEKTFFIYEIMWYLCLDLISRVSNIGRECVFPQAYFTRINMSRIFTTRKPTKQDITQFYYDKFIVLFRSQWPHCLKLRVLAAQILGSWVRFLLKAFYVCRCLSVLYG
jgi:hypothetical protein